MPFALPELHLMIYSSTSVLLFMIAEEEWSYLNDWEEGQLRKKKTKINKYPANLAAEK